MKSFYEQFKDRIDTSDGTVVLNYCDYQQIQLDAMKEGARRAASICAGRETESDLTIEATRCRQIILTTAEQWTVTDL